MPQYQALQNGLDLVVVLIEKDLFQSLNPV